ncbi:hypothetical protein B9Z19DRAFT_1088517 [Tuber borchii]|uniref:Uncharacterized protein n=1 Tax=Tuber borchii TaxID=42251 RepID=A0A2T6ZLE9_TUBBO|nr:hypothetical protein B9Z19DRAFT_1088517 [Tuber borchii]
MWHTCRCSQVIFGSWYLMIDTAALDQTLDQRIYANVMTAPVWLVRMWGQCE